MTDLDGVRKIEEDFFINTSKVMYTEILEYNDRFFNIKISMMLAGGNFYRNLELEEDDIKTEVSIYLWSDSNWRKFYEIYYKNSHTYNESKRKINFDKNLILEDRFRLLMVAVNMFGNKIGNGDWGAFT